MRELPPGNYLYISLSLSFFCQVNFLPLLEAHVSVAGLAGCGGGGGCDGGGSGGGWGGAGGQGTYRRTLLNYRRDLLLATREEGGVGEEWGREEGLLLAEGGGPVLCAVHEYFKIDDHVWQVVFYCRVYQTPTQIMIQ
jgi:hypothetical protein